MSATTTHWILELVDKISAPLKSMASVGKQAADSVDDVGKKADQAGEKVKGMSAIDLFAINDAVQNLAGEFEKLNAPGAAFNAQLKDLEAITGISGEALDSLGEKGRETAKVFGGDASAMIESYKGILSRLGPDIAKNEEALDVMGRNVATLSKTMGNDATGAMDALTTSMLQFGVDLSDPLAASEEMTRLMNVMAAGAKEGASEVPQISEALKQAGVQALDSKVSFEETNAALQALAQGGKYGSEAGVALRNVLGKMAGIDVIPKEAADKLQALGVDYDIVSDKTLPFTDRLRELAKAQGDATIMAQVFGTENAAAAQILLRSVDYQDNLTQKITGTNTAIEQADVVMGSYNEKMARMNAWFNDLKISLFDVTSKMTPFVSIAAGAVMTFANLANAGKGVKLLFTTLKTMPVIGTLVSGASGMVTASFGAMATAAKAVGVAIMNIPILGWIVAIVAALIALGTYFYNTSESFRGFLWGLWEAAKTVFTGMGNFIMKVGEGILHVLKGIFNPANWFDDDYKFSDGFKKIADAATGYGNEIGKSFAKGRAAGMEDFKKDQPEGSADKATKKTPIAATAAPSPVIVPSQIKSVKANKNANSEGSSIGMQGGGGGTIKNISQKIEIKNYFTVSGSGGTDYESIAERIVRAINDKLSDSIVVAS